MADIKYKIKRKHEKDIRDLENSTNTITMELKNFKEDTRHKISSFNFLTCLR